MDLLEGTMADTTADANRCPDMFAISKEYLAELKELADRQGWSIDGTVRRSLAVIKAALEGDDAMVHVYRNGKRYSMPLR
jgi:hypothetical protein